MRAAAAVLASFGVLTTPAAAQEPSTVADQPAATLLLPYFEVDLANPAGANMRFTVNNASASAVLAHVTIWSAMHVPVHAFNVYLTGYDAQPIDLRQVLNGNGPATASDSEDPQDTISPQGPLSQDISFGSCAGQLPAPRLPQSTIDHIRAALTGTASPLMPGMCATFPDGTPIARGYVTVDTVSNCTTKFPSEAGYFAPGGTGDATNENVLWGDYVATNHLRGREREEGGTLVHIRANGSDPETNAPGQYTFYGRLVNWSAADNREPLSTLFGARFNISPQAGTTLTVWRDAKINQGYFACGGRPSWYPLGQESLAMFDEQEEVQQRPSAPFAPQPPGEVPPFPAGTQRVQVGGTELPTTFSFGWIFLNLNTSVMGATGPGEDAGAAQAWVSVQQRLLSRYSVGSPAVAIDTAKSVTHFVLLP